MEEEHKQRVIQEYVPGKQITLAHIIANPNSDLYKKLGIVQAQKDAIGILTITPSEAAIIAADIATKVAATEIVFMDRFSGSLVLAGDVSSVEASINAVIHVLNNIMNFSVSPVTKT